MSRGKPLFIRFNLAQFVVERWIFRQVCWGRILANKRKNSCACRNAELQAFCFSDSRWRLTMRLLEPGHLEDRPFTTISENKTISSFFGKQTNNIHKLEGCFMRGQVSKIFNGFIVQESWILLVRLWKNLRIFRFQKSFWWDHASKCPGSLSSRTETLIAKKGKNWLIVPSKVLLSYETCPCKWSCTFAETVVSECTTLLLA